MMRLLLISAAILSLTAPVRGTAKALPSYPVLAHFKGLTIYGPARGGVLCPHALSVRPGFASTVRNAVAGAMPAFERPLRLNGHDAVVRAVPAASSGMVERAAGCGARVWRRSFVAYVRLPHVREASLSQHRFAVARILKGLVLWAQIQ